MHFCMYPLYPRPIMDIKLNHHHFYNPESEFSIAFINHCKLTVQKEEIPLRKTIAFNCKQKQFNKDNSLVTHLTCALFKLPLKQYKVYRNINTVIQAEPQMSKEKANSFISNLNRNAI